MSSMNKIYIVHTSYIYVYEEKKNSLRAKRVYFAERYQYNLKVKDLRGECETKIARVELEG